MAILDENQTPATESSVSIQPVVVKWGLISAVVSIIFQLISGIIGFNSMALVVSLVSFAVGIYLLVMAVKADRDEQLGGYASFKRVFLVAFSVIMISAVISQVFNFIYMNYINPAAAEAAMEAARAMMEKFNMPEDAMEKAMEEAENNLKSPMNIVKTTLWSAVVGAIVSAIFGAVMKKERAMFN